MQLGNLACISTVYHPDYNYPKQSNKGRTIVLYNVIQLDLGKTLRARRSNANLEETFLPNRLTCSFQEKVFSIVTPRYLKVSTLCKLVLSAATEKLSTALSL